MLLFTRAVGKVISGTNICCDPVGCCPGRAAARGAGISFRPYGPLGQTK